ncbi:MAG: DUF4886 domain-containing protein [Roseibium sp.]|uniref:DUF4886 domain-containing protein n=1 Tax=Roseibium sp. TaxID=1936156 RepID=UPI003D9C580E
MLKIAYISLICILPAAYAAFELASVSAPSENDTKILFVGNSLTLRNNLPSMVQKIAASKDIKVFTTMHAKGGAQLSDHARDKNVKQTLDEMAWDYVILQEQSQLPALRNQTLAQKTLPYAGKLADRAREVSPETKVVFYMAMAHKDGDQFNKERFPEIGTYRGMQSRINAAYRTMARQNRATVAPVGEVWAKMRARHPNIMLYVDERHPSVAGTYLAACVFFTTLFSQGCSAAYHPQSLDDETASIIQQVSDAAMLP